MQTSANQYTDPPRISQSAFTTAHLHLMESHRVCQSCMKVYYISGASRLLNLGKRLVFTGQRSLLLSPALS